LFVCLFVVNDDGFEAGPRTEGEVYVTRVTSVAGLRLSQVCFKVDYISVIRAPVENRSSRVLVPPVHEVNVMSQLNGHVSLWSSQFEI
jgi:hypothetical protein